METILAIIAIAVALFFAMKGEMTQAIASIKNDMTEAFSKVEKDQLAQKTDLEKQKSEMLATLVPLNARLSEISEMKHPINELNMAFAKIGDRGYIGEMQLQDIVRDQLPAKFVQWQTTLPDGKRPDCLLDFPQPVGKIVIDAKFPSDVYQQYHRASTETERKSALKRFRDSIKADIDAVSSKYIEGNMAEKALLFIPSEGIFSLIHEQCNDLAQYAYRKGVFIVSPATLWAVLNTIRAVLRDVEMKEHINAIKQLINKVGDDAERLSDRAHKLQKHFNSAQEDVRGMVTSANKIGTNAKRIAAPEEGNLLSHD